MENNYINPTGLQRQEGIQIDFKRIAFRALRYWYLIVLSLLVAFTIAFLQNRYATPVYPVTASIIIKEAEEAGGAAELLYKNELIDPYRNYFNEIYLLKSYSLLQKVIEDINLEVSFYREGRILTLDAYSTVPVEAELLKKEDVNGATFAFQIVDQQSFSLKGFSDEQQSVFKFNTPFTFKDYHLVIRPKDNSNLLSYRNKEFQMTINNSYELARSYAGRLNIEWAEAGASVVKLNINGSVPQKEIDFLKGLISRYQKNDLDRKNQAASRTIEFINTQLREIRDSLRHVEIELEMFKNRNVTTNLEGEALRLYQRLEAFELQKTELMIGENYYKYLEDYLAKKENMDQVILPTSMGISDPILTALITKMIDLQLEIKSISRKDKISGPLLNERLARIEQLRNDVLESVKSLRSTDKIKVNFLSAQVKSLERQISRLPIAERQLVSIQRNYGLLENLYVFLMQKMAEAGISQASNVSDIIIVNPPSQAGGAISPRKSQNYYTALAIGLLIPLGVFVLLEIFNTKIQSREDVEKITGIPFIGGIGHKNTSDNLVVNASPKSAVAESFRALRSNLNYFTGQNDKKVFLVTSSLSGEGKTFTSVNLASVLALSGKPTVLIGADMRRPRIFDDFKLNNDLGLSSYLAGLNTWDQVVQKTSIDNLYLLSAGPVPPNPGELLLKDELAQLFEQLKTKFSYIILDSPPVALVTDAFVLSKYADHTLFVVRQNYTPKNVLRTIDDYHRDGRIKNISLVLNDIFRSGPGYGYGYGYYYGYGYSGKGNEYYE